MKSLRRMRAGGDGEGGNVLFLILIVVALFAALMYAMTKSQRGSGSLEREEMHLLSTRVMTFAGEIMTSLNRMRVINGVPEYLVDYSDSASPSRSIAAENTYCVDKISCALFTSQGGQVVPLDLPAEVVKTYPVKWRFMNPTIKGIGPDTNPQNGELVLYAQDIDLDFCMAFNNYAGIANSGGLPPVDDMGGSPPGYSGPRNTQVNYSKPIGQVALGLSQPAFYAKTAFCSISSAVQPYGFIVIVLLPR